MVSQRKIENVAIQLHNRHSVAAANASASMASTNGIGKAPVSASASGCSDVTAALSEDQKQEPEQAEVEQQDSSRTIDD